MKKISKVLAVSAMSTVLLGMGARPIVGFAAEMSAPESSTARFDKKVSFIGQWTGESSQKVDTEKTFTAASDKLGEPVSNPGSLRGLAKIFLGWSDKAPEGNGKLAEGARYFSPEDSIERAFPDGIPDDAKIYGIYYSLNSPNRPFTNWDIFSIGNLASALEKLINDNTVTINKDLSADAVLPDTNLSESIDTTNEDNREVNKIVDTYNKKDDSSNVNEVVLKSEFKMNSTVAMLVYRNKEGSNAFRPILSYDYNTRYGAGGEFGTGDNTDAGYTYVDLIVNIDEDIKVPEKLYLEFSGYSWRPLYVMGSGKTTLNILNPSSDKNLGNTKESFSSLVKNDTPSVVFGIETKNNHEITIRMVLREGKAEKIPEKSITPDEGKSIIDKILSNMTLKAFSGEELKRLKPGLSSEDYNKRVLTISDAKAKELAKTNGTQTLKVSGGVRGYAVASAGSVSLPFIGNTSLKSEQEINLKESNILELGYVMPKKKVTYKFESEIPEKELPEEITGNKPADLAEVESETSVTLPTYNDIKVDGGTWEFKEWKVGSETASKTYLVDKDTEFVGIWRFIADPTKPTETLPQTDPTVPTISKEPENPKVTEVPVQTEKNGKVDIVEVPGTGDKKELFIFVSLLGVAVVVMIFAIFRKKRS